MSIWCSTYDHFHLYVNMQYSAHGYFTNLFLLNICNSVLIRSFIPDTLLLQAAMGIGNTSNAPITGQPYQSSATISSSRPTHAATPVVPLPTLQIPSLPTSTPLTPQHDAPESINSSSQATNLVKPSFFVPPLSSAAMMMPPVSSSIPTAPPLHPTGTVQRPYGTPMLQPFPPPTPPPSLAPVSSPLPNPAISREKVRDALLVLVQVSLLSWELVIFMILSHYSLLRSIDYTIIYLFVCFSSKFSNFSIFWLHGRTINSLIWFIKRC